MISDNDWKQLQKFLRNSRHVMLRPLRWGVKAERSDKSRGGRSGKSQLLPAIISINLAHGAKRMAQVRVIVKRLAPIENFGSMNVICSDKTSTLTEGIVDLQSALDVEGVPSEKSPSPRLSQCFLRDRLYEPDR
jgi:hypothetical protein